jgi:hypothetical protein
MVRQPHQTIEAAKYLPVAHAGLVQPDRGGLQYHVFHADQRCLC